eukprot:TRINITY_DN6172_c0_g1_i1.p1 TRINITY_DN6172_c0_g1~~TRINITY_DN6172_c0_g1_i1.p1  ORF type:complete len:219 (-),score=50.41 TRINITY_DN6172_c0_g1_i1:254-910(-)
MGNNISKDEMESLQDSTQLDPKTIKEFQKEFQKHANKDGDITKEAFKKIVMSQCVAGGKSEETNTTLTNYVFKLFDADNSGKINFREFILGISYMNNKAKPSEVAEMMFRTMDLNGDGSVSKMEIVEVVKLNVQMKKFEQQRTSNPKLKLSDVKLGINEMATINETSETLLRCLDKDKSGKISQDEFVSAAEKDPKVISIIESLMIKPSSSSSFSLSK